MKKMWHEGRKSLIFLDETWVNKNYTASKCWIDKTAEKATGVQTPTGRGGRLIVLHAGNENGFVPNAELIFEAKNKGDYHHQMNRDVFEKWFRLQLLPNIPAESMILMDNASYHSVIFDKPPTCRNTKSEIKTGLNGKGQYPEEDSTKSKLIENVKQITTSLGTRYSM